MTDETANPPEEVRLAKDRSSLVLVYADGPMTLGAEYLRVMTRSAEARGHAPSQAKTVYGKRNVRIIGVEAVGNYALRLTFDDGHDSGIYAWSYLQKLDREREQIWSDYLGELTTKGLSRDA